VGDGSRRRSATRARSSDCGGAQVAGASQRRTARHRLHASLSCRSTGGDLCIRKREPRGRSSERARVHRRGVGVGGSRCRAVHGPRSCLSETIQVRPRRGTHGFTLDGRIGIVDSARPLRVGNVLCVDAHIGSSAARRRHALGGRNCILDWDCLDPFGHRRQTVAMEWPELDLRYRVRLNPAPTK
jgi:hypothetical protein